MNNYNLQKILNMFEDFDYLPRLTDINRPIIIVTRNFLKSFCTQVSDHESSFLFTKIQFSIDFPLLIFNLPYPYKIYCSTIALLPLRTKIEFEPMFIDREICKNAKSEEEIYKLTTLKVFT